MVPILCGYGSLSPAPCLKYTLRIKMTPLLSVTPCSLVFPLEPEDSKLQTRHSAFNVQGNSKRWTHFRKSVFQN